MMNYLKNIIFLLLLSSISSVATILLFSDNVHTQQTNLTENKSFKIPEFFAIQHAFSGSISKSNTSSYTLELNNISNKMILFSDSPNRLVKSISTEDFINKWIKSDDLKSSPTKVELVLDLQSGQDSFVVELLNPIYQKQNKLLKYDILVNDSKTELQSQFGEVTLVIDSISIDPKYLSNASNQISFGNKTAKENKLN